MVSFFLSLMSMNLAQTDLSLSSQKEELDCGGALIPDLKLPPSRSSKPIVPRQASQDKIHVIDVAFIYDSSITDKSVLMEKIKMAVSKTNIFFRRGQINARLRVVAVKSDDQYGISLRGKMLPDALKEVHSILPRVRDEFGADLLYGLTGGGKLCGLAYLRSKNMSKARASDYAVGVVRTGYKMTEGCLGRLETFTHEVGHNLGLVHQEGAHSKNPPFLSYGKGHEGLARGGKLYGSIMAIKVLRLKNFSRDGLKHDGLIMGTSRANAAKALLYTIEDASHYAPTKIKEPRPKYSCHSSLNRVCLQKGRFSVEGTFSYENSSSGLYENGKMKVKEAMLDDSASLFYFFDENNIEIIIKVLDGCGVNGKYWIFGSVTTDLDYTLTVMDHATGTKLSYGSNSDKPLMSDISAFSCDPLE